MLSYTVLPIALTDMRVALCTVLSTRKVMQEKISNYSFNDALLYEYVHHGVTIMLT